MQKHKQKGSAKDGIKFQRKSIDFVEEHTSSAVGRSLGSKASSLSNNRSAKGSALGNFCASGTGCFFLMLVKYLLALSFRTWIHKDKKTVNTIKYTMCSFCVLWRLSMRAFSFGQRGGVIDGVEDMTIIYVQNKWHEYIQNKMQNSSQLCTYQRDCIQWWCAK